MATTNTTTKRERKYPTTTLAASVAWDPMMRTDVDLDALLGTKVERCCHGKPVGTVCFACVCDELGTEDTRRAA